jgi:hypothetical protein
MTQYERGFLCDADGRRDLNRLFSDEDEDEEAP